MKRLLLLACLTSFIFNAHRTNADVDVQGFLNTAAMENLAADPTCTPASTCPEGRIYWNTVAGEPRIWDGSAWQEILAGASSVPDPLLLGNGSNTNPTYSFASDPASGLYLSGANTAITTSAGGLVLLRPNGSTTEDVIIRANGTVSADYLGAVGSPTYSWGTEQTSGMWFENADDSIRFSVNSEQLLEIDDGAALFSNSNGSHVLETRSNEGSANIRIRALSSVAGTYDSQIQFGDTADTDRGRIIYDHSTDDFEFWSAGAQDLLITSSRIRGPTAGNAALPTYTFDGVNNQGMYSRSGTSLGFSNSGVERFIIGNTVNRSLLQFQTIDGTETAPGYTFTGDTNMGMWRDGSTIRFSDNAGRNSFSIASRRIFVGDLSDGPTVSTAAAPGISWSGDTNTGIYRTASSIGISEDATSWFQAPVSGSFQMNIQGAIPSATNPCVNNNSAGQRRFVPCSSLRKYKEEIKDISEEVSNIVYQLKPVEFRWKGSGEENYGFIAEEVETVAPKLNTYDDNGVLAGVNYNHVPALSIAAIQYLEKRVYKLESEKEEILKRLEALESK